MASTRSLVEPWNLRPSLLLPAPSVLFLTVLSMFLTGVWAAAGDGPRIRLLEPPGVSVDDDDELQLLMGDNLTLLCEGGGRLSWSFPKREEPELADTPLPQIKEEQLPDGGWRAELRLPNTSCFHTGYYNCALADAPARRSSLYIYVADPEYPWVQLGVPGSWAMQYEEGTLDCRPNNKSIHVTLLDSVQNEIPLGFNKDTGWTLRWAPSVGFRLGPVNERDGGVYFCRADGPWDILMLMMNVMPRDTKVTPPVIHPVEALPHAVLGQAMELQCSVRVTGNVFFHMEWELPASSNASEEGRLNVTTPAMHLDNAGALRIGTTNLTVVNLTDSDAGNYTCVITDHSKKTQKTSFEVEVKDGNVRFIDLKTQPAALHQVVPQNYNATWTLEVVTFPPEPTLAWFGNDRKQITSSAKYVMKTRREGRGDLVTLSVMDVDLRDRGVYLLKINTKHEEMIVNLTLTVLAAPVVQVESPLVPVKLGTNYSVRCRVQASPRPSVEWAWKPCPGLLRDCSPYGRYQIIKTAPVSSTSDVDVNSTLTLLVESSGFVSCRANNSEDSANDTASIQVTDMPDSDTLVKWGPDPAVEGDDLELWCGVLRENHTEWPQWRRVHHPLDNDRMQITRSNTSLSLRSLLRVSQARISDSGTYECVSSDYEGDTEYILHVKPPLAPYLVDRTESLNDTEWLVSPQDRVRFPCHFSGLPKPRITWHKDGHPLVLSKSKKNIHLEDNGNTLVMAFVTEEDQGEYRCKAENRVGKEERWAQVTLRNRKGLAAGMIAIIVCLAILSLLLVPLAFCVYKDWKRRRTVILGLTHFTEGQPDVLNPDLPADEQAELLPYDRKWEFPRDRLKLGKQLGAGAFGVVLKAEAQGIMEGEETTTVAVKMVKRTADFSYLKALASELKIMVHLGRHLNVVNLLGACTGKIERQELLVIVEYCRFGNLHNYLLRHREGFVDQVDPRTGAVDASIGAERLAHADSFSRCGPGGRVKYASLSFSGSSDTTGGSDAGSEAGAGAAVAAMSAPVGPVDYRAAAAAAAANAPSGAFICIDSAGNETISMSPAGGDDAGLTSSGSAQPHWRSNYRGDYRGGVRPICTRDLLCWSYQVARGMQYLARRKVLHGDLAARNILLADGNIVKICDFGLAKSMYKSDNYKKKGDGPLPVKWMALESIRDRIFSTQSDVWSFGIVLWELFSLAQTPYPGMAADERLYSRLQDGYRMEKPLYATDDLYGVMLRCWETKPVRRPAFEELAETLGTNLEESVRNHYLDLNSAYIVMNEQWQRDGATDYLGMLGAPDYSNLVAPRDEDDPDYINSPCTVPPSPSANSGYLLMRGAAPGIPGSDPATPRSAAVFSPRPVSGAQVFTFEGPRAPAAAATTSTPPPITITSSHPSTPNAVDNPNYITRSNAVLNPGSDNYVNVPKHRIAAVAAGHGVNGTNGAIPGAPFCAVPFREEDIGVHDAFSNPGYVSGAALGMGHGQHAYA